MCRVVVRIYLFTWYYIIYIYFLVFLIIGFSLFYVHLVFT